MHKYFQQLVDQEVTFSRLLEFTEEDLTELGIAKGPRVKILRNMHKFRGGEASSRDVSGVARIMQTAVASPCVTDGRNPVPHEFVCPITQEIMDDPVVVVASGQTYERREITTWFRTHTSDPCTGVNCEFRQNCLAALPSASPLFYWH